VLGLPLVVPFRHPSDLFYSRAFQGLIQQLQQLDVKLVMAACSKRPGMNLSIRNEL
jgi:hypothetical protein